MADNQTDNSQDNSAPSIQDLAGSAQASYEDVPPMNYTKLTQYSNPEISTFKHKEKPHFIISHKGTDLKNPNTARKDIRADLNIALGNKDADGMHKRRAKQTEQIIKSIKKETPNSDIYMASHSLGGSTTGVSVLASSSLSSRSA